VSDSSAQAAIVLLADMPFVTTGTKEGCGKQVVKRHRHEAESAKWPSEALIDLDAPEDYERVMASMEQLR